MSNDVIDNYIFDTRKTLWKLCGGMDAGDRAAYPLVWYIKTGRASSGFIRKLLSTRAFVIARILSKPNSVDGTINAICRKIKYIREA